MDSRISRDSFNIVADSFYHTSFDFSTEKIHKITASQTLSCKVCRHIVMIADILMYWWFQVNMFKDYIPQAFPHGRDLILDGEVLLIDVKTGKPLPFGSLGKHKVILCQLCLNR